VSQLRQYSCSSHLSVTSIGGVTSYTHTATCSVTRCRSTWQCQCRENVTCQWRPDVPIRIVTCHVPLTFVRQMPLNVKTATGRLL